MLETIEVCTTEVATAVVVAVASVASGKVETVVSDVEAGFASICLLHDVEAKAITIATRVNLTIFMILEFDLQVLYAVLCLNMKKRDLRLSQAYLFL